MLAEGIACRATSRFSVGERYCVGDIAERLVGGRRSERRSEKDDESLQDVW